MDRREFLITTGAAAAATASATPAAAERPPETAPAAPAVRSGARMLRLAMPWPDNGRGFGDSARRLLRRIETASGGRYGFSVVEAARSGREAVGSGEADLHHGIEPDHADAHRAFAYFGGLPGHLGMEPHDFAAWIEVGGGQALWDDLAAALGYKPLLAGHTGHMHGLWSLRPITSLADIAGQRLHVRGLSRDVVRALGAEPATLPVRDIPEALGSGAVFAAEWGGLIASSAAGIAGVAKHHTAAGITQHGGAIALGISKALWDGLSAADQTLFTACAAEEHRTSLAEARGHEMIMRSALRTNGLSFSSRPSDVADAIERVSDAVVAHVAGTDARAARINASYMAFRAAIGAGTEKVVDRQVV